MTRSFNTAGPCDPLRDYMLPAAPRLPAVASLIERGKFFVVHAPRQVGKTTTLFALARELTDAGRFTAVLLSVEVGAPFSDDPLIAERAILDAWRQQIEARLPEALWPPPWSPAQTGSGLRRALSDCSGGRDDTAPPR